MRTFIAVLTAFILVACTKTVYVPVDRVRTVTNTERDTIIKIKPVKEMVYVVTRDTIARARTSYAEAEASLTSGQLALNLQNLDVEIPVETKVLETFIRDSVPYPVEVTKYEEVRYVPWYDKVIRWLALACIILNAFGINVFDIRKLFRL